MGAVDPHVVRDPSRGLSQEQLGVDARMPDERCELRRDVASVASTRRRRRSSRLSARRSRVQPGCGGGERAARASATPASTSSRRPRRGDVRAAVRRESSPRLSSRLHRRAPSGRCATLVGCVRPGGVRDLPGVRAGRKFRTRPTALAGRARTARLALERCCRAGFESELRPGPAAPSGGRPPAPTLRADVPIGATDDELVRALADHGTEHCSERSSASHWRPPPR